MGSLPFPHTGLRGLSFGPRSVAAAIVVIAGMIATAPSYAQSAAGSDAVTASKDRPAEPAKNKVAPPAPPSPFTYDELGATPKIWLPRAQRPEPKQSRAADQGQMEKASERAPTKTPPRSVP
ncbi:MAG: hypothetical protein BroJett031_19210 [Betaproteobacteria bacterium]|nr:MAG: hypothetical protein BroJett031_19210 [Betaproteobacteria bacterium]